MKSFIYIMGVALLLVFCSCEKQGEQEQGTQRTEQGQGEKPEPESPEEPPLVENWDLIEITRAEVGNSNYEELLYLACRTCESQQSRNLSSLRSGIRQMDD